MPVIKSAAKRMRQEEKRRTRNRWAKAAMKSAILHTKKAKDQETLSTAFSQIDKTAKKNIIHKNKAAHLKSQLSKLIPAKTSTQKSTKKTAKNKKTS